MYPINVMAGLKQEAEETVKGHDDGSRRTPTNGSHKKSFTMGSAGSGGLKGTRASFVGAAKAVIAGRGTNKSTRFSVGVGDGTGSGGEDDSERRITATRTMSGCGQIEELRRSQSRKNLQVKKGFESEPADSVLWLCLFLSLLTSRLSYLHISFLISMISHASCSRHEHGCIYWAPSQEPTPKS